ncbi:MAG: glycosyltransferase family 39 protein, partial [Chloroflexia bacterium]|nr:glycosyltransferase family 39 protein [Chloroflexia bacterium]
GIVSVTGLVGITAILSPPNTPDALNYHMPRVAHWIQNRSLDFYPTTVPWQLSHAPGAEFAILHLQLLSDGDRWANLVQWFAMAGSITGVSLLARDLGADRRTQVIAAAVAATIPMGILQGATAQNDYVATFWLVACVHFLLRLRADRDWQFGLVAGAALGLALLTKSTAYLFALPFLVWYGLSALRSLRLSGWKPVLAISLVALALNAGHYARNYDLYGSPVGPGQEGPPGTTYGKYTNDVFTVTTLASNVVRNLALHTALPGSTVPMVYAIGDLHRQFGADPHDIRTTWTYQLFDVSPTRTDEDIAGNPLHLALALVAAVLVLSAGSLRRRSGLLPYAAAIIAGALLFALVLKWTPWVTRLHLTLFVLAAPVIAIALGRIRWRPVPAVLLVVLFAGAIPYLLYAERRPLVGDDFRRPLETAGSLFTTDRQERYVAAELGATDPYAGAAAAIQATGCDDVGLYWFGHDEYPLWVALGKAVGGPRRLQAVAPENATAPLAWEPPFDDFTPCAIVSLYQYAGESDRLLMAGTSYRRVWTSPDVGVYLLGTTTTAEVSLPAPPSASAMPVPPGQ